MLNVIVLSVVIKSIILSVIVLNFVVLAVVIKFNMLSVIVVAKFMLSDILAKYRDQIHDAEYHVRYARCQYAGRIVLSVIYNICRLY
jgi:hypothetical protein